MQQTFLIWYKYWKSFSSGPLPHTPPHGQRALFISFVVAHFLYGSSHGSTVAQSPFQKTSKPTSLIGRSLRSGGSTAAADKLVQGSLDFGKVKFMADKKEMLAGKIGRAHV